MPPRTRKTTPAVDKPAEPMFDQLPNAASDGDRPPTDTTPAAPTVIGDMCPLCWPAGPPAGAAAGGCEHGCQWHIAEA